MIDGYREYKMEKEEKKEYQKPELIEHENLNEVTKGDIPDDFGSGPTSV